MSNQTVVWMTIAVLASMAILFALNLNEILSGKPPSQTYLQFNDVRGMAVKHDGVLYTLNFDQQKRMIEMINQSDKVERVGDGKREAANFEEIVIYRFDGKDNWVIKPVAYINNDLFYSMPEWHPNGYLMDVSDGKLKTLILETYDK